jgi:hypothetical protein
MWSTNEFIERNKSLKEGGLSSLYPSQAWAMYRILPKFESILDVGFTSLKSYEVVKSIAPCIEYTGIDIVKNSPDDFNHEPNAEIITGDFFEEKFSRTFSVVQAWQFVYVIDKPFLSIEKMYFLADDICMFDIRANYDKKSIVDIKKSYSYHQGCYTNYVIFSWHEFKYFIESLRPRPEQVEFSSYYYPTSEFITIEKGIKESFISSIIIRKGRGDNAYTKWIGREIEEL